MPVLLVLVFGMAPGIGAEEFTYKYIPGDKYRILSTVTEDVYLNQQLSYRADILNRIAVSVESESGGTGFHRGLYQTAEAAVAAGTAGVGADSGCRVFQWSYEYDSADYQDGRGLISIEDQYFMPMVRNLPVFPAGELQPGAAWTAEGYEVHDFRGTFGIPAPYRIPFSAAYTYLGEREWRGNLYPAVSVIYRIFAEPAGLAGESWPRRILGSSSQIIYWDSARGRPLAYEEDFRMIFELSNGLTVEYRGQAQAELIEAEDMDKEQLAQEIAGELEGVEGATVRITGEGISISLEDINFAPDSAVLEVSEQAKLDQIMEILARYPGRDILVAGHTARAGSPETGMQLSQERAGAVADYLIGQGARSSDRVIVRGYGDTAPIADNNTEAGRERNRRVEIIILEN
jgi:outer membrane protein OmpA-like peptidoglycan-associated protein